MAEQPGIIDGNSARPGVHARPAQQAHPLDELRRDLTAVLSLLQATRTPVLALGRKRANRFSHAVEAARREVRRALEATAAGPG